MTVHSTSTLRTLALAAQNLHLANGESRPADREAIYQVVERIGCVQIDTLQMVRRSQYLVAWSRLGTYAPDGFDRLLSADDRRLFEGWQHAACIIPLSEYRFQMVHQRNLREHPTTWYTRWLSENVNRDLLPVVLERIRREGGLKVSDFESDGRRRGSWWDWRPAKVALEHLYAYGALEIAGREKFQRIYDLAERVIPAWVDMTEPTAEQRDRFWVERGALAMGAGLPRHAGDYVWMKVTRSRPIVKELVEAGVLVPIQGRLANGEVAELVVHRDNLSLLEQAADGSLQAARTTFLSPFDNLLWANRRDEMFWGFHQALECYLPAQKRIYGYFCLPILHRDRLVGRFDPKLERKTGLLRIKALYLEPGVKAGDELVHDFVIALRDFMAFHDASDLAIEKSQPATFAKKVLKAM